MKTRMPMMRYNFARSGLILLLAVVVFVILPALITQAANFVVDDTSDGGAQPSHCTDAISGNCSLRDAIQAANNNGSNVDTITFNVPANSTIVLTQGRFTLNHPVTINGPNTASNDVIIDGNGQQLFFINISTGWTIITDLTLKNGGGGNGGVIHVPNNKNLRLERCTISDTTQTGSSLGLAIFVQTGATFIMDRCTVTGISGPLNQQTQGTIFVQDGATASITNSTISGNQAQQGSAIYNRGGNLTLTHCTITENTGNGQSPDINSGAAIYISDVPSGSTTITNTLVVNNTNTASGGPAADCGKHTFGVSVTITRSVMNDHASCGTPATAPNLVLCALQDNGGPTLTHKICADPDGDVIDQAGNCHLAPLSITIDQTGASRPEGAACDIGAVEEPGVPTPTPGPIVTPTPTPTPLPGACPSPKPTPPPVALSKGDLGSHTFPTYLFVASYDWLHHFYDRNARGARGSNHQADPDTDNFNKVIVLDSNLFPIMTAVVGDHEFPNITSRNTLTWMTGSASSYTPSVNDYFNRGIAVAPNYITKQPVKYSVLSSACESGNWVIVPTYREMNQYGARSMMQWTFVTDPGNNNIRRYEFEKFVDFFELIDADSNIGGTIQPSPENVEMHSVCGSIPSVSENKWFVGDTETVLAKWTFYNHTPDKYESDRVLWTCKHGSEFGPPTMSRITDATGLRDYLAGTGSFSSPQENGIFPYLEFFLDVPQGQTTVDIQVYGNGRDNSSNEFAVGINTVPTDPGGIGPIQDHSFAHTNASNDRDEHTFSFTGINNTYDRDTTKPGVQIRVRLYSLNHGGFIIDKIQIGEQDSAFTVKYDGSQSLREVRWNVITSFLETVPPESYPGYHSYTSSVNRTIGYGYQTNTSFTTAKYVRFKDPRDIDVYRDMFDSQNNGPTYIFVADTGNSRIQVFMNATGSVGETNANFPIRPVRVKGPNVSDFRTNELAMRPSGGGYGHGRKADWRWYTTMPGTSFQNITAGKGEFYQPHGVAVDQDPNTKDVYLFVADTFNHRIQIFRDVSGVSSQPITNKRFDFQFERGWGTYPLQPTLTMTPPGSYNFRYPKGLDIVRFHNNSSYLYVVDSKNYRVMKYLITENAVGGISSISAVAGYGYNGTNFVSNLTTIQGVPMEASITTPGFLNPQDVATGYNGFYLYSAPNVGGYPHQASLNGQTVGVHYLNNYMLYVTDYARNHTSITHDNLNMRVMQFFDHPQRNINGVFLPWKTGAVGFGSWTSNNLTLGQSGLGIFYGVYSSDGWMSIAMNVMAGSTENVPGKQSFFTDRPVGIATLAWDTVNPFDIRVIDLANKVVYPNGTTIDNDTLLRVGVHSRAFFGIPYTNVSSYTNFTSTDYAWDGRRTQRVHVFCYDTNGVFQNHTALLEPPFEFTPGNNPPNCPAGYMKIIAEEDLFEYSGKSGTQIFKVID